MYVRALILIAGCFSLAGCFRTVIESPVARDGGRDDASGVSWFALTSSTHDAQECKHGIAKAETYMPVWGAFVYWFTGGIAAPMKVDYYCAAAPQAQSIPPPAAPPDIAQ